MSDLIAPREVQLDNFPGADDGEKINNALSWMSACIEEMICVWDRPLRITTPLVSVDGMRMSPGRFTVTKENHE